MTNVPSRTWVFVLDTLNPSAQEQHFLESHQVFVVTGDEDEYGISLVSVDLRRVGLQVDDDGHVTVPEDVKRILCIGCHDRFGHMYNRRNHEIKYVQFPTAKEWRESTLYQEEVS